MKSLLFEVQYGLTFEAAQASGHPSVTDKPWVHNVYPGVPFAEAAAHSPPEAWRFCILRDPLSRVVSCYRNRIGKPKTQRQIRRRASEFARQGLVPDPDLDTFVTHLAEYRALVPDLEHHSRPLSYFLGTDPGYFHAIYPLHGLSRMHDELALRLGPIPPLWHFQKDGLALTTEDLSPEARQALNRAYAEDNDLFGAFF